MPIGMQHALQVSMQVDLAKVNTNTAMCVFAKRESNQPDLVAFAVAS